MNILVVGLGLIGGSIVKGLKNKGHKIYGHDINKDVVELCYKENIIINQGPVSLDQMDVVFVCLYPEKTIDYLKDHMHLFKKGAIITDVVGLKEFMMTSIQDFIREDVCFIGGHPMAGREGSGFSQSTESIFYGANYLLVIDKACEEVHLLKAIISDLGCGHIEVLDAKSHDDIIAYTSHMPHILSTAYMTCDRFEKTKHCVAGSFRDITRVSDINAGLWTELIMDNRQPVLNEINEFKKVLSELEDHIINKDHVAISKFLEGAKLKKLSI
ncbi:prephenate dehydrogenase/arogenate dehydrogenase family protein [Acidaminobacter sp. JC074]|uniref:prephenate dehydrogenase n=1 Tax=Acidaminobacter sp. JC074 TaxID=2530199 RepID=UPI001F105785|nr:prephenate dehydrogenase/arogenate dehydrogenase family protein [Acidaminobacter sp. JC074]MCH4886884.1 prephenate dehydrogenase/arogenate dehydrogenase family protein [Acidaminobacter sp. JC074]